MRFQDLPTEIVVKILIAAAYTRGLKRALRLRLVCKSFSTSIYDALFATDMLDRFAYSGGLTQIRISLVISLPPSYYHLWQSYLALRVQSPKHELTERMVIIKRTAELYCLDAGLLGNQSVQDCIWALCDIEMHTSLKALFRNDSTPIERELPQDDQRAVLVVAARMNNVPLAKKILEEWTTRGYQSKESYLHGEYNGFKCPTYISARYASNEVMDLFLQDRLNFGADVGFWHGCGRGGNIETLSVLLKNRSAEVIRSQPKSGSLRYQYFHGLCTSRYPTFFDQARSLSLDNPSACPSDRLIVGMNGGLTQYLLYLYAASGYSELVEHLIKLGVPVNATAISQQPLRAAARSSQPGITRLLLKHGADPNQSDALMQGTKAGSLEVVRILLNHGANVHDCAAQLITLSIHLEHTSMFNLLRECGAFTEQARRLALEEALKEGLDSMVTLLNASN